MRPFVPQGGAAAQHTLTAEHDRPLWLLPQHSFIFAILWQGNHGRDPNGFREKTIECWSDLGGTQQKLTARNTEGRADKANGEKRQSVGGGLSGQTDRKTGAPSLTPEGEEISSACRENETLSARARRVEKAASSSTKWASVSCSTLW